MGRIPANPKAQAPNSEPYQGAKQPARPENSSQERESGGKWRAANLPWHGEEPQSCWSWWRGVIGFLCFICQENTAQQKVWEEALALWQEGCRHPDTGLAAGRWPWPLGCSPLMQWGLAEKTGIKKSRVAERWHMQVRSSWDTRGKSALGNASARRAV